MDQPPPPYSEIAEEPTAVSGSITTVHDERSSTTSSVASDLPDNLYSLQHSANEYFSSRPLTTFQPAAIRTCCMNLDPQAQRQDIHFPLPESALLASDVTVQDWFTFINHLYPQNASSSPAPRSAREEAALPEKRPRHDPSIFISRKPLPSSARPMSQSSSKSVQEITERNRAIDAVIRQWNEGFFLPRGLQIERERPRITSTAGGSSSAVGSDFADRVARGIENSYSRQRYAKACSPSNPANAPEAIPGAAPEAIYPTRRASEDAPSLITEINTGSANHPNRCSFTRSQQPVHPEPITTTTNSAFSSTTTSNSNSSNFTPSLIPHRPKAAANFLPGTTPQEIALYKAITKGDKRMTKLLLQNGVSPAITDTSGVSALHRAVTRGDSSIVKLLIEQPIDPNMRTAEGDTPLYRAVERGDASIVRYLLMLSTTDVEARNGKGKTPLIKAVQRGDAAVVEMLLEREADIGAECNGVTALSLAAEKGQSKIAKLMLRSQERVREPPWAR